MSSRRRALVLLLIVGFAGLAGGVAGDGCDDVCEPHCGDCAACPLLAELPSPPQASGPARSGGAAGEAEPALPPPLVRPHDHVPLAAA